MRPKWQTKTQTLQNRKLNVIQWFSKMPDSCCAVGCSNRRSKGSALNFTEYLSDLTIKVLSSERSG